MMQHNETPTSEINGLQSVAEYWCTTLIIRSNLVLAHCALGLLIRFIFASWVYSRRNCVEQRPAQIRMNDLDNLLEPRAYIDFLKKLTFAAA